MTDYIEILTEVRDFYLEDPSRWTKGTFARDDKGCAVDATNPNAVSFCMIGVGQHLGIRTFGVSDAMGVQWDEAELKESFDLADWNDALTFDQMIQGLNARIAMLRAKGEGIPNLALDNLVAVG